MHEYRRLVEQEMDAQGFTGYGAKSKLAVAAGISKQVVGAILNDTRERLIQVPEDKTVEGLAKALKVAPEVIWASVAISLGLPSYVVPSITHEVKAASNEDLLRELARRLDVAATVGSSGSAKVQSEKTTQRGRGTGRKTGTKAGDVQ